MATRLATTRNNNFITVTAVKNEEESDANTSIATSSNTTNTVNCTSADIQRAQLTPVSLHHVNLSQVFLSLLITLYSAQL